MRVAWKVTANGDRVAGDFRLSKRSDGVWSVSRGTVELLRCRSVGEGKEFVQGVLQREFEASHDR